MDSSTDLLTIPATTVVTTVNDSPSGTPYSSASSKSGKKIGPIVGGIVAGIVVAIIAVAMIVPCARRRQKRQRVVGDDYGEHRVLKKAADVEATEPMMNGSWRDHSRISDEDRMRSISSGKTVVQPGYIESLPVPKFPLLQPVKEGVAMGDSVYRSYPSATYFPQPQPMPATWAGRQSSKTALPRFPSLDKLWPLTSAFRTSIYSSPSTKTKSSGASSAPSRGSKRRPSARRGRSTEEKEINPEALTSPTVLGQELGLGRGRTAMDKEIKHARPPTIIAYQTAPMHRGFSLKDTTSRHPTPPPNAAIHPPRASYSVSPENPPRRRTSADGSEHRHHRRKKSTESGHRTRSHNQPHATRHHRQNSTEHSVRAAHHSRSRSRSRSDNEAARRARPDVGRVHPSQAQVVYNYHGQLPQ